VIDRQYKSYYCASSQLYRHLKVSVLTLQTLNTNKKLNNKSEFENSRLYQLTSSDCNHIHIGQTDTQFETRFIERVLCIYK
jgi:hypothetical protein